MKHIILILFLTLCAYAHKLNIFTDYANGTLFVQSYYASGDACNGCAIKINDANGTQLYDGTLDSSGKGEVKINLLNNSKVVISASGGHLAQANIDIDSNISKSSANNMPSEIDNNVLQSMIEEAVAKQMRPLMLEIQKSNELSLEKIFSGLGYILGIFGIWALMRRGD